MSRFGQKFSGGYLLLQLTERRGLACQKGNEGANPFSGTTATPLLPALSSASLRSLLTGCYNNRPPSDRDHGHRDYLRA